jgi:hypothetical protein
MHPTDLASTTNLLKPPNFTSPSFPPSKLNFADRRMVGVPAADWSPEPTATGDGSHRNIILFPPEMNVRLSFLALYKIPERILIMLPG